MSNWSKDSLYKILKDSSNPMRDIRIGLEDVLNEDFSLFVESFQYQGPDNKTIFHLCAEKENGLDLSATIFGIARDTVDHDEDLVGDLITFWDGMCLKPDSQMDLPHHIAAKNKNFKYLKSILLNAVDPNGENFKENFITFIQTKNGKGKSIVDELGLSNLKEPEEIKSAWSCLFAGSSADKYEHLYRYLIDEDIIQVDIEHCEIVEAYIKKENSKNTVSDSELTDSFREYRQALHLMSKHNELPIGSFFKGIRDKDTSDPRFFPLNPEILEMDDVEKIIKETNPNILVHFFASESGRSMLGKTISDSNGTKLFEWLTNGLSDDQFRKVIGIGSDNILFNKECFNKKGAIGLICSRLTDNERIEMVLDERSGFSLIKAFLKLKKPDQLKDVAEGLLVGMDYLTAKMFNNQLAAKEKSGSSYQTLSRALDEVAEKKLEVISNPIQQQQSRHIPSKAAKDLQASQLAAFKTKRRIEVI
jgi:hypothetical protein